VLDLNPHPLQKTKTQRVRHPRELKLRRNLTLVPRGTIGHPPSRVADLPISSIKESRKNTSPVSDVFGGGW
jgi:hypothetical protein